MLKGAKSFRSKFKIPKGANSYGDQILSLKNRKTATLNSQTIRMLRTHVNNEIYNKYCLIHNSVQTLATALADKLLQFLLVRVPEIQYRIYTGQTEKMRRLLFVYPLVTFSRDVDHKF